jgi:bifunctional non-homologous end joining protein LigD
MLRLKGCSRCGGDLLFTNDTYTCIQCGKEPSVSVPVNRYAPMLAKLTEKPFDSTDYIYEPKLDGIRCVAYVNGDETVLINRSGNDVTTKFPEIRIRLRMGYTSAVLDGELVCLNDEGVPAFQQMQTRMNRKHAIAQTMAENPATLVLFDILELNGTCLCNKPLYSRKVTLDKVMQPTSTCTINDYRTAYGTMWLAELTAKGWEGIMAKLINGRYCPGKRGPEWLKMKARKELVVYVGAVTQGMGRREDTFGALMVGIRPTQYSSRLTFMGEVGTGYTDDDLSQLTALLSELQVEKSPFVNEPPGEVFFYVKPKVQIRCTYLELTNDNIMRHAAFKGVVC